MVFSYSGNFSKHSSPFDDTVKDAGEAEKGYSLPRSDLPCCAYIWTQGRLKKAQISESY